MPVLTGSRLGPDHFDLARASDFGGSGLGGHLWAHGLGSGPWEGADAPSAEALATVVVALVGLIGPGRAANGLRHEG